MILSIHNYNMTMRKILVALTIFIIFCPITKEQTKYKLTINADTFFDLQNDYTIHEHTTQAYCTTDPNKTIEVKWASYDVTADNSGKTYTYQGIYIPTRLDNITGDPKLVLFIGANNKLYWLNTSNLMKTFRAYFILPSVGTSSNVSLSTEEQGVFNGISLSEMTDLNIQGSPSSIYTIHSQLVGTFSDQLPKNVYLKVQI